MLPYELTAQVIDYKHTAASVSVYVRQTSGCLSPFQSSLPTAAHFTRAHGTNVSYELLTRNMFELSWSIPTYDGYQDS